MKDIAKQQASVLRKALAEQGINVSVGVSLNAVSRLLRERDWNNLVAQLAKCKSKVPAPAATVEPVYSVRVTAQLSFFECEWYSDIDITPWMAVAEAWQLEDLYIEDFDAATCGFTTEILELLESRKDVDTLTALDELRREHEKLGLGDKLRFELKVNETSMMKWVDLYHDEADSRIRNR